ncbi:MAG: DinB family protein [Lewinellaceae bacterium]|nr:DinB family protein [Lewinellaceae bacterium]
MQLLENLTRQTEGFLQKAVSEWQMLPPEALSAQASAAQWSAAQCLEHLNIYGRYYLPAIEKAIRAAGQKRNRPVEKFRSGWLGDYFVQLMRPKPDGYLKSKMKSPKNAVPAQHPDPRAMLAEFIDQQETMLKLLDAAASVNLNRVRIPISIAPWLRLKLGDTFLFMTAHIERHLLQAERAIPLQR